MKTPREKFAYTFIVLIFIALFLIHFKCKAQEIRRTKILTPDGLITRKAPIKPMFFYQTNIDGDTIETKILSIFIDSIGLNKKVIRLMLGFKSEYPKVYYIKIGFTDGQTLSFSSPKPYLQYDYKTSTIIYEITKEQLDKLKSCNFNYLEINSVGLIEPCVNIKEKSFFVDFLAKL